MSMNNQSLTIDIQDSASVGSHVNDLPQIITMRTSRNREFNNASDNNLLLQNKYSKRNKDYGRESKNHHKTHDHMEQIMKNPEVNIRKAEIQNMKRMKQNLNFMNTNYSPSAAQLGSHAINLQDGIKMNASLQDKLPNINSILMTPESNTKQGHYKQNAIILETTGSSILNGDFPSM